MLNISSKFDIILKYTSFSTSTTNPIKKYSNYCISLFILQIYQREHREKFDIYATQNDQVMKQLQLSQQDSILKLKLDVSIFLHISYSKFHTQKHFILKYQIKKDFAKIYQDLKVINKVLRIQMSNYYSTIGTFYSLNISLKFAS